MTILTKEIIEPAAKRAKVEETVFLKGVDGKENEYCPYTETSKAYDGTRAPLGLNIALGTLALGSKPLNEQKVLDIGCGTGTFIEAILDKVESVSGLEYNDGMIGQARTRLAGKPKVGKLIQGSADNLADFADGSFDACTFNQVIHHFPKDDNYAFCLKSFQECFRVLKPGGYLVLNTSMPEQQRDAFWWLSLFPKASDAVCDRFPPMATLEAHMKKAGFEWNADSVSVPLHRSLMADAAYLKDGVKSGFKAEYRAGDSSWSMAENFGELDEGLKKLQKMIDDGTADEWLAGREKLRKSMGQATFISVRKPL
jgi:ubiquinone/menaquinone biosynthesis C-methylase UbiE